MTTFHTEPGLTAANDVGDCWSHAHANFLANLSPDEHTDLMRYARRQVLNPRDSLFRAGDTSGDVYIVAGGCVRLFQVTPGGKETILWFSFAGKIFGLGEMCTGHQRQIHAVANEATMVYSIRRDHFTAFLGEHPEAAMKAIAILSARVRAMGHMLVCMASDNVETRLARLLMRFAAVSSGKRCCSSTTNGEMCVNVRLTHQDIGNLIAASRQTVTTTLLGMRRRGVLRTVDHHIHIVEPGQLQRVLDDAAA